MDIPIYLTHLCMYICCMHIQRFALGQLHVPIAHRDMSRYECIMTHIHAEAFTWSTIDGPYVAVRCGVLQCVAVFCSVLQCVAVWCSVVQCVALWCSGLQCGAVLCGGLRCDDPM